ncbi:MAG: sensor histidine kinase [Devosia sp.]
MPISTNVFVRATTLLLIVGFLALVGIVGSTIWLVEQNQGWFDRTEQAGVARSAAVKLRSTLLDSETGQRGFLLTGDAAYLAPYTAAIPAIPDLVNRVVTALALYPQDADAEPMLRTAVNDKVDELAQTIALAQGGQRDQALALVNTDSGKASMDIVRRLLEKIIDDADADVRQGSINQANAGQALRWVTIVGAFVIFAVVGSSVWTAIIYTRELALARREVELANSSLEARVSERTSDLGRANEEIQRFAYIVTHDLRAPLVNIMGFTSELETNVGILSAYMAKTSAGEDAPGSSADGSFEEARIAATEDLPEAIGFIRAATRKMDSLINAILKISREGRRRLKPESLDLPELVRASADAIHHQVVDNAGEIIADVRVPVLVSDRLSLEQVLGNLLDNAVKYRSDERPLRVTIAASHLAGNRVAIDVADNGRGIADTDHERVFELFRRSGVQSQKGEGIGLAHVRTLVRSLGGDITLRSELGVGTTFTIILPRDLRSFLGSQTT